jgi:hypothetical protein
MFLHLAGKQFQNFIEKATELKDPRALLAVAIVFVFDLSSVQPIVMTFL